MSPNIQTQLFDNGFQGSKEQFDDAIFKVYYERYIAQYTPDLLAQDLETAFHFVIRVKVLLDLPDSFPSSLIMAGLFRLRKSGKLIPTREYHETLGN